MGVQHSHATATPLEMVKDARGEALQSSMIWASASGDAKSSFVAFRKKFVLPGAVQKAELHLFADIRYMVWINGEYVLRGPARFEPTGPEYDSMDVLRCLKPGTNEIVVLVMSNSSNGKMRSHVPGLTARLEIDGKPLVTTDSSWKWSDHTRYRPADIDWGNTMDRIDTRVEDGDWTLADYNDAAWKNADKISGDQWGPLSARRIPLLRETPVPIKFANDQKLPATLHAGERLEFHLGRLVQAYTVLEIDADADTELSLDYARISYFARAGRQIYVSSDTHGFADGSITVQSGRATIVGLKLVERIYPFDVAGSFRSSDPLLDKLWRVCARSLQVMSEDAYVDCSDRERTEWMDCTPPDYEVTRTAMVGPGENGRKIYGDPRLLGEMLRRTALTIQPDGWVKAHTCSDRFDIHAKMEDRACDWVEGARLYYDSTGNPGLIREIWPTIVRQMQYFLDRRSPRGLVIAREWVIWGDPMGYQTSEGAGLNAFVYKALVDAAYLGKAIGKTDEAVKFDQAAKDLAAAFNRVLWDEKNGTYYSGYETPQSELPPGIDNNNLGLPSDWRLPPKPAMLENRVLAPTVFPALFALDQEIVPANRREQVMKYLLAQPDPKPRIMYYYYYWKQLYAADKPDLDVSVLSTIRQKWKAMANSPWQTTWEEFGEGSQAHCYGMFPGYFLSAYVLGVRPDGPASGKRLLINPRLGDLTSAEGSVVTEFGPVPVSWKKGAEQMDFEFEVPAGVTASLQLPAFSGRAKLVLDNQTVPSAAAGQKYVVSTVSAGKHRGKLSYPAGSFPSAVEPPFKGFHDDFTKANAAWSPASGTWAAQAGSYVQSDATALAVSGIQDLSWSDATYAFSLSLENPGDPTNWAGFQFRKPSPGASHAQGGYMVYLRANGSLELYSGRVLQAVQTGVNTSKLVHLKVVAKDDHLQVYLNDEPKPRIDVTDGTYTEGYAGYTSQNTKAAFGPLSVTAVPR